MVRALLHLAGWQAECARHVLPNLPHGSPANAPRLGFPVTFAFHDQAMWQSRADDPRHPDWLRVACLAYATNRANGHAQFPPRALALAVGLPSQQCSRAVRRAVELGWLMQGSGLRCLVLPLGVRYGPGGDDEPCGWHHRGRDVLRRTDPQPEDWGTLRHVA